MSLRKVLNCLLKPTRYQIARKGNHRAPSCPPDFTPQESEIVQFARPFTMANQLDQVFDRVYPVVNAVTHVVQHKIPGSVVECGVWRGGMMVAAAKTLLSLGDAGRELYLFDTFAGMTPPTKADVDFAGKDALSQFREASKAPDGVVDWCYASLEDVRANMYSTGYPKDKIHFIKGKVEETLPGAAPQSISVLRLDTDWYESSKHEMVHLFPRLQPGGVLILDDYGYWLGSRKAIDEYFKENSIPMHLVRIDNACRVGVKH